MKISLDDFLLICSIDINNVIFIGPPSSYYETFSFDDLLSDYNILDLFVWRIELASNNLIVYICDTL